MGMTWHFVAEVCIAFSPQNMKTCIYFCDGIVSIVCYEFIKMLTTVVSGISYTVNGKESEFLNNFNPPKKRRKIVTKSK